MSLTILFQTPVDTGTANVTPNRENAKALDFYLLTGKKFPDLTWLRRTACVEQSEVFKFYPLITSLF